MISFLGITVHWIREGQMQTPILDFVKCVNCYIHETLLTSCRATKAHTGIYLAGRISECLHDFGIQNKVCYSFRNERLLTSYQILALTLDNASNNNTLVEELTDLLEGYQGSSTRIRCFAHVLNLVVKVCKPSAVTRLV